MNSDEENKRLMSKSQKYIFKHFKHKSDLL